jgi:putative transposase
MTMTPLLSNDPSAAPTLYDSQLILSFPPRQPQNSAAGVKSLSLHYHVILHLKPGGGLIDESWRGVFYKYAAGCLKALRCEVEAIGGSRDHLHLLIGADSGAALADIIRRVKLLTQSWVERKILCCNFAWQEDYQAFTVSLSERGRVKRYILNRREHKLYRRAAALGDSSSSSSLSSSWGCVLQSKIIV